jgi:hypothetical protein
MNTWPILHTLVEVEPNGHDAVNALSWDDVNTIVDEGRDPVRRQVGGIGSRE